MKRVIAGCIDLTLEFDTVEEYEKYVNDITAKHQTFHILKYQKSHSGKIYVRVQRQYNNSPFPAKEGGDK